VEVEIALQKPHERKCKINCLLNFAWQEKSFAGKKSLVLIQIKQKIKIFPSLTWK
jgi:hypothetical protein